VASPKVSGKPRSRVRGNEQETINLSEADKQRQMQRAEGVLARLQLIAEALAEGLRRGAEAINTEGGKGCGWPAGCRAVKCGREFGKLAKTNNTMTCLLNDQLSELQWQPLPRPMERFQQP